MRRLAAVVVVSACGRLDFDAVTRVADAPAADTSGDAPAACTSWGPFGAVMPVSEFAGMMIADPAPRADHLELYFALQPTSYWHIWHADRAAETDPYTPEIEDTNLNINGVHNQDPSLSADGLTLAFYSNRTGNYVVYLATRARTSDAFGPPTTPAELATAGVASLSLVPDGSALYVEFAGSVTRFPISAGTVLPGSPVSIPRPVTWISISADERELFYAADTANIGHLTRASTTDAFGNEEILDLGGMSGADPAISPDGSELWIGSQTAGGLYRLTRSCQ